MPRGFVELLRQKAIAMAGDEFSDTAPPPKRQRINGKSKTTLQRGADYINSLKSIDPSEFKICQGKWLTTYSRLTKVERKYITAQSSLDITQAHLQCSSPQVLLYIMCLSHNVDVAGVTSESKRQGVFTCPRRSDIKNTELLFIGNNRGVTLSRTPTILSPPSQT